MGFTDAVKKCLRDWITFSGRAPRSELWWFVLFYFILFIVISIILSPFMSVDPATGAMQPGVIGGILMLIVAVVYIYIAIAALSAQVRRLHDKDKSGWWWWLGLVPLVGPIILIVWYCMRGTIGPNQFGNDPLGGEGTAKVFE